MIKIRNFIVLLILILLIFFRALGKEVVSSKTETAWGLHTATFDTLHGKVIVNLPDDLAAGDTISGTVIAEPKGKTKEEREENTDVLNGYVVEVEKDKTSVTEKIITWSIPAALVGGGTYLILRDQKGKEISRTNVPVNPIPPVVIEPTQVPTPGDYQFPIIGQAGRPVPVKGPFNGDFQNTDITVGGQEAEKLAESPRKLVARSPRNIVGPTKIKLIEGGVVAKGKLNNLRVKLASPKTTLLKGESTTVTATVEGLQGLSPDEYPIPFEMVNQSPNVVRFEESAGSEISHSISYNEVSKEGTWTFPTSVLATQTGEFNIGAIVQTSRLSGYAWKQDVLPCDCEIKNLRVVKEGDDAPQVEYVPEKEQDRIKFKFKILADVKTSEGEGAVELTTDAKDELWLYKGTREDRDKHRKLFDEGVAAFMAGKKEEADKKHKEADELWKKLKPEKIDIKQAEKQKDESQELDCGQEFEWSYEPEGEFWWEGENYRIGTADKPQTRSFWLIVKITIKCGKSEHDVSFYWSADVGWDKGKVKKSNEKIEAYAF